MLTAALTVRRASFAVLASINIASAQHTDSNACVRVRQDGRLHSWLAAVPKSTAAHGSRVAVLSSLHEAMVVDAARPGRPPPATGRAAVLCFNS